MNSRRSWLIFAVTLLAYLTAVLQRSSLGVAGVYATDRFDIAAAALSTLAVVQLVVYASLQPPLGVILDRFGPRALLVLGALLMAAGQATLAFSATFGVAVLGRLLVGAGDAMTFISALRLLVAWFSGRTLPQVSQWLGTVGQFGQLLSAVPLTALLHDAGWTPALLSAAALSLLSTVALVAVVRRRRDERAPLSWPAAMKQLVEALARPGTQLGFWSHFSTQSSGTVFSLLWGFPLLSVGLGYGPAVASAMLALIVLVGAATGPVLGLLTARFPLRRSNLVLAIVCTIVAAWAVVLLWPDEPPFWLVVVLVVVIAVGGPGSLIGFDFARTFNPQRALGSANGVVNVGGFLASFVMMFLIGVVLDALDRGAGGTGRPAELYSWEHFRIALTVQFPVLLLGTAMLLRARRRTRAGLRESEGIEVAPLWVSLMRRWRRRR